MNGMCNVNVISSEKKKLGYAEKCPDCSFYGDFCSCGLPHSCGKEGYKKVERIVMCYEHFKRRQSDELGKRF